MDEADVTMILDRNLNPEEKEKFIPIRDQIATVFIRAGRSVRVCEATGDGADRKIGFLQGLIGTPFISISSDQFLISKDDEFLENLEKEIVEK